MHIINIAVAGIGNCASSLLQGIECYKHRQSNDAIGLMHWDIGGYKPYDIKIAAAFDIDKRKVGKDASETIFELPNCTTIFCESVPKTGVKVLMGPILDGFSEHMRDYEDQYTFVASDERELSKEDCIEILRESKTEAVQSQLFEKLLSKENIHIGPSDWVAWQKDNKICFLRMEGKLFGDIPMNLELRLSVEDSPNSGGVVIDAIRCCKIALERGKGGILYSPSAYFMKHPPKQLTDDDAFRLTEDFIQGKRVD